MKRIPIFLVLFFTALSLTAQTDARLLRYLDVSQTQITFVYGGDIWLVPIEGGTATQLTNSLGEESYPRFSPDGQHIAYSASYNGNLDVYVLPVTGGIPVRVTYQSASDRMLDWHPDGDHLLFASRREMGPRSSRQLFKVHKDGGMPERLPLPYGELATYSPDGRYLAYVTKITENYPFKRYRGGLASDILIYDSRNGEVENVTNNHANDGKPAFGQDNQIYFTSDQGEDFRLNLYAYDTRKKEARQVTEFTDFDISSMAVGPNDLVFEKGGTVYRMNLGSDDYSPVNINVIHDRSVELARSVDVRRRINNATASPEGKRVVFEARGELFNAPVSEGFTMNMTNSSGAFDRDPAWSPDGKWIAFWSDRSGENEIYLQMSDGSEPARKMTNRNGGYGYTLNWSPNSEMIAFIDHTNTIHTMDVTTGDLTTVTRGSWHISHPGFPSFTLEWSPNSQWLTFSLSEENSNNALYFYDTRSAQLTKATSSFYSDYGPIFSKDGQYVFFMSDRNLRPIYSSLGDGTWVYPNATQVAAISLQAETPSLLASRNDAVSIEEEEEEKEEDTEEAEEGEESSEEEEEESDELLIDFDDFESRLVILPIDPGNIFGLMTFDGKLGYVRGPNSGAADGSVGIHLYDLEEREEKPIIERINFANTTADGKQILVAQGGRYGIIKPAPGQKIEDAIPTDGLVMNLVPRQEWEQIFTDTWRRHRDFFYDPAMHGLDWNEMRSRYGDLLEHARTRWDVTYLQSNLAAELSAGHTYTSGGDTEQRETFRPTGYLGIDWEKDGNQFKINRIVRPAVWDTEVRSPFDQTGLDVKAGDYILSVNGQSLDPNKDPYAHFEGLAGHTVSLQISRTGSTADAKEVIIECLGPGAENRLRHLEWIESMRLMVDELSDGKLGYIYMSNTGGQGQLELVRMYYGQIEKEGFIIDERFNGGGQLADRFLELLKRPVVYNLAWRHGRHHTFPIKANTGPMGMLINGWAGSGGDGLPWAFQELEAGPIVGERTLGILVGPATGHSLIDGGRITVPGARLYDNDGHWFWEGEGVAPDIEVWDDPNIMMQGRDPQVERVVQEVMQLLETQQKMATPVPPAEDRTAEGMRNN